MLQSRGVQWAIETDKLRGLNHAANLLTYDADGNPTGIKTQWSPKGKGYDKKEGKTYSDLKTYIEALRSKDPSAAHNDLDMGTRYIATDTDGKPLQDQNGNPIYLNGQQVKGPQYHILNDNNPTVNGRWQDYYVTVDNTPIQSMPTETVKTNETPVESAPKADADQEQDKFPKRSVWGDVGRIAAQAGIAAQNIMSKPDYTHANAVASAARRPIRYVGFNPVGIRQAYNPADPFFLTHQGMAQNRATAQDLLNIGNGNQGAIAGNLIMNNYQSQLNQGQNYYQAHQQNTAQQLAANQFNAQQEQFNSNGLFNAGRANQDAYNQAQRLITDADIKSAVMKQSIDDSKAKALSQGISGIVNGVSTMFDNDYNNKLLAWKLRHNKNPISQMDNTTANGGKLNRRKYKGFNL